MACMTKVASVRGDTSKTVDWIFWNGEAITTLKTLHCSVTGASED